MSKIMKSDVRNPGPSYETVKLLGERRRFQIVPVRTSEHEILVEPLRADL